MGNIYTEQNITKFFEGFKSLQNAYHIERVHQLLNNPNAKARYKVGPNLRNLKFIIMTSTFIIGALGFMLWLSPKDTKQKNTVSNNKVEHQTTTQVKNTCNYTVDLQGQNIIESDNIENQQQLTLLSTNERDDDNQLSPTMVQPSESIGQNKNEVGLVEENEIFSSQWPEDTLLDKTKLFVTLTENEQERLGLFYMVDSTKFPQMEKFSKFTSGGIDQVLNGHLFTRVFNALNQSNLSCTDHRWDSPFYSEIDTLIPVIVGDIIYWHLATPMVLDSLPIRYHYLKETYANLKDLKKKNPERQLVNYWNKNMILGDINYLKLSKEELANIGVKFDSLNNWHGIEDPYTHKTYYSSRYNGSFYISNNCRDIVISDNLPLLSTDKKGLNQSFFSGRNENDKLQPDLFIPIKIPFSNYINGYKDAIYWYNPTDSFINLLPDRIKYQLKEEKEWILNDSDSILELKTKTCTYFEVCRSNLQIDHLKVYPNPARKNAIVEFYTNEDLEGNITLTNMAGVEIRQLIQKTQMKAGANSFSVDISGLPSGIFIILVNTDKGFKTQRILVSQ